MLFRNEHEILLQDEHRRQDAARHQQNYELAAEIMERRKISPRRYLSHFMVMFWARPRYAQQRQPETHTPSGTTAVILPSAGK